MNILIKPLLFDSYLAAIKNSTGCRIFRNFYAEVDGVKKDIMENGNLSCALYVSSILTIFQLAEKTHGTVNGTICDLEKSGWFKIEEPRIGAVLVWELNDFGQGSAHKHIGFYIGDNLAISNSSKKGCPSEHHWTYGQRKGKAKREVDAIYWHDKLS